MFEDNLFSVYQVFLFEGGERVGYLEDRFGFFPNQTVLIDERRNIKNSYALLFSGENKRRLEELYFDAMKEMEGADYDRCDHILRALEFIQQISATAMWRYGQSVSQVMEDFVRDFDRLDVPAERHRLYEVAQMARRSQI
jgi:hypothetical protein